MDFLPEDIDHYAHQYTAAESELLAELNRYTQHKVLQPRMLSGHLQGRVLAMISKMIQPKLIVEVGTYTGYAALCLAEGLAPEGALHTIDINDELESIIRKFVGQSPYRDRIHLHIGDARDIIPDLPNEIDLAFIDADKENYLHYFQLLIDKMRDGGILIADNVLWSGKVCQPLEDDDESTKALVEFNRFVHESDRVENVLLPVRDGLMILRKLK